jgi:hypothetical protein
MYDIQRIMESIKVNVDEIIAKNQPDVLRIHLDSLKNERKVFTIIDNDLIQEHNFAFLDYVAMEAVESDRFTILALLYQHLSSERHTMEPDSCPLSVKDLILTHLIQQNKGRAMIQTILDDESYDPSYPHDNAPLQEAIKHSNVEIIALLLAHPRVKICEDTLDDGLMTLACLHSDSDAGVQILQMFLDDSRFNPSRDANGPIHTLAYYSLNRGLACIMNCPRIRWDWFGSPSPLARCVENKNMEGVGILLSEPRYDPCMNNNDAYHAAKSIQDTHPEFMAELLSHERIAKSIQK